LKVLGPERRTKGRRFHHLAGGLKEGGEGRNPDLNKAREEIDKAHLN